MATIVETALTPDVVMTFALNPGTLRQFLEARAEKGPRLKCVEGSVTLVSPGKSHEAAAARLDLLILAVCREMGLKRSSLESTTWTLPPEADAVAYEADKAYYLQSYGTAEADLRPDLAIEIVVTHPEDKALRAGAILGIPEIWVYDLPRRKLTFHQLITRGRARGTYRAVSKSRAFPALTSARVLEQLEHPEQDDIGFHDACRDWARRLIDPQEGDD